jgi:hypothetical protein
MYIYGALGAGTERPYAPREYLREGESGENDVAGEPQKIPSP